MVSMSSSAPTRLAYPDAPRDDVREDHFGVIVADPYRWLEDLNGDRTRAWIDEQNALTQRVLAGIPQRDAIHARLTSLWNYERRSVPGKVGDRYAYFRNTGLQNQSVLMIAHDPAELGRALLDPNTFSEDGTVALSGLAFSDDGARLAYATSASGSDWKTWHVRDVATGHDLPDLVRWSKFSGAAWRRDGDGFYYSRYDEPVGSTQFKDANYFHKLYYHRLGTPQSTDLLVYERPDHADWNVSGRTTEDGRYLIIDMSCGTDPNNGIVVRDLVDGRFVTLCAEGEARYSYAGNDGATFYFLTTRDAPRGRVIAIDLDDGASRELIAETNDAIGDVSLLGETFIVSYLRDALAHAAVYGLDGAPRGEIALPGLGSVSGFGGKRKYRETFYAFTSYTAPTTIYRYDLETASSAQIFAPHLTHDPSAYASHQVFYTSKDGTRIPMIITAKRDLAPGADAPTILSGYGGFDIALTPEFSPAVAVWLEMGGVYAVPNLRGGGEYGEAWHLAGIKEKKQNVFDDCIAAAEYLIAERWTSPSKLALKGGSNGGLLVGACVLQRPDLFAAALPAVGVMDMLRFAKFTIGWAWVPEYGSPDDADDFANLLRYSPYHNLAAGTKYPATLITTGDHDDRVYPAHSLKFAAALQHAQGGDAPILLRVDVKAGHGSGKPTAKVIDEVADRYAFLVKTLDFIPA
jgi:prolyl oligopeptidase